MRGLAEFVMKGRKQAIMAVLLLGLIPLLNLLSPVLVGLVVLRKGFQEAVQVLVWAILPIGGWALAGDPVPLIMLLGITGLAGLLRSSESWEFTLLAAIAVGVCVEIYLRLQPAVLDLIFLQMQPYFDANGIQGEQLDSLRNVMTSFMGAVYMFLAIILLMLSRWMQAALYNPGGFKLEFHQLRFSSLFSVTILIGMFICEFFLEGYTSWSSLFGLPLMLGGIALLHYSVTLYQLSSFWLVGFYLALLFLSPLSIMLVGIGFLDSIFNIRPKLISHIK